MLKKRRLKRRGPRPVRVGDLVHAWDSRKQQSMDAHDDDGHVIGYVRAINDNSMDVVVGGTVIVCWNEAVVIQRFAARLRYYLDEKLVRYHPGSSAAGGSDAWDETLHHRTHGPYPGPATARLAMRFLGEDRLRHGGITFQKIDKGEGRWFFAQSEGADRELTFQIVSRLEVLYPKRKPLAK